MKHIPPLFGKIPNNFPFFFWRVPLCVFHTASIQWLVIFIFSDNFLPNHGITNRESQIIMLTMSLSLHAFILLLLQLVYSERWGSEWCGDAIMSNVVQILVSWHCERVYWCQAWPNDTSTSQTGLDLWDWRTTYQSSSLVVLVPVGYQGRWQGGVQADATGLDYSVRGKGLSAEYSY